jgi:hypothetical protein
MAFWTCSETATSVEHVHDYDAYMVVVQGCYTLVIHGERIAVKAGVTGRIFTPRLLNPTSGNVLKFLSDFELGRYGSLTKCGIGYMPV